ncbi:protein THEMIS2 [Pelodytes ibericus]
MEEMEQALPLCDFISSVLVSSLPRILKIASGVYLQSSVYDLQGIECSLSTGDLVKVISKQLESITCLDPRTGECHKLSAEFQGVFQVSVDRCIYNTFGKLHRDLSCGDYVPPFWFSSLCDINVGGKLIRNQVPIQYLSAHNSREDSYANCMVYDAPQPFSVSIPFSTEGQYCECESKESYTLQEVLQSPSLLKRNLKCSSIGNGSYSVSAVYEITTIMQMRRDLVKIPSTLEVDVIDITDKCADLDFIKPVSLTEASECEDKFPIAAEILECPKCTSFLKSDIFSALKKGQKIVIHKKAFSRKLLATASKGKLLKFFYIHYSYQGKFRQRPREFATIYDLWSQLLAGTKLKVVVTQDCDSHEGSFPSLYIGDHLQVLHETKDIISTAMGSQEVDLLVCIRESADDEEEAEEIMLPLYLEGRFVEEVTNCKKYSLGNLVQTCKLPCEVKVVAKDPSMNTDPLSAFSLLRLEELIEEPVLLTSFLENPTECFELPVKYSDFSLIFLEDIVLPSKELNTVTCVEELTECFYYGVRKDMPNKELPPPRPPKRQVTKKVDSSSNIHKAPQSSVKTRTKAVLPIPVEHDVHEMKCKLDKNIIDTSPVLNTYSPPPWKGPVERGDESDHDYEVIEADLFRKLHVRIQPLSFRSPVPCHFTVSWDVYSSVHLLFVGTGDDFGDEVMGHVPP